VGVGEEQDARDLSLCINNIGYDGACDLEAALERNKTLKALDLSGNNIGSDGAAAFRTALERNNTLTVLVLGRNGIGDVSARCLAEALEQNRTLKGLYLSSIGSDGARRLAGWSETPHLGGSTWVATISGKPVPLLCGPPWKPTAPLITLLVWVELRESWSATVGFVSHANNR
jgi:hypothetical protein